MLYQLENQIEGNYFRKSSSILRLCVPEPAVHEIVASDYVFFPNL